MVDQAKELSGNGRGTKQRPPGVRRSLASLASDVVTLAELQGQLLLVDARESARRTAGPAGLLVGGLVAAFAAVLLLLTGAALLLDESTALSTGPAFLVVAASTLLFAAGLLYFGWKRLQTTLHVFHRSRIEFVENLNALKSALRRQ
jgi:hypothetical protein